MDTLDDADEDDEDDAAMYGLEAAVTLPPHMLPGRHSRTLWSRWLATGWASLFVCIHMLFAGTSYEPPHWTLLECAIGRVIGGV
jgi:hypothetical protein